MGPLDTVANQGHLPPWPRRKECIGWSSMMLLIFFSPRASEYLPKIRQDQVRSFGIDIK